MTAADQLELDVADATERRFTCCGQPAPPLSERPPHFDYPHAEDCPNPNLGVWFDRYGRIFRRLHCINADGSCPTGGRFVAAAHVADPYDGRCCIELRSAESSTLHPSE